MITRRDLATRFERETRDLKTWVVEAHPREEVPAFLEKVVEGTAELIRNDATLWSITDSENELELIADTLGDRFWRFHTWSKVSDARSWLNRRIERTSSLDWAWFPAGHLRVVGSEAEVHTKVKTDFGGRLVRDYGEVWVEAAGDWADEIYELIDGRDRLKWRATVDSVSFTTTAFEDGVLSTLKEKVDRGGRFKASGNDFKAHERYVSAAIRRYAELVELVEDRSLRYPGLSEGGHTVKGSPILLKLSRDVPDMDYFLQELFSCREPFRLFGNPREADGYWTVEAVDLHVGQRVPMDLGDRWIRVYLREGACGNTVVRLASNLEHHLDAKVHFADPDLQSAFTARPVHQAA